MMNDLKLNLYGTFLLSSTYTTFYSDFISILDYLSPESTITILFYLGGVWYYLWKLFVEVFFLWRLTTDYFLKLVLMISYITWLYCLEESLSRNLISIYRTVEFYSTNFFFSLFSYLICIYLTGMLYINIRSQSKYT